MTGLCAYKLETSTSHSLHSSQADLLKRKSDYFISRGKIFQWLLNSFSMTQKAVFLVSPISGQLPPEKSFFLSTHSRWRSLQLPVNLAIFSFHMIMYHNHGVLTVA